MTKPRQIPFRGPEYSGIHGVLTAQFHIVGFACEVVLEPSHLNYRFTVKNSHAVVHTIIEQRGKESREIVYRSPQASVRIRGQSV